MTFYCPVIPQVQRAKQMDLQVTEMRIVIITMTIADNY